MRDCCTAPKKNNTATSFDFQNPIFAQKMEQFRVRKAHSADFEAVISLYRRVSLHPGGIARATHEISEAYVRNFSEKAQKNGLQLVVTTPFPEETIVAEIHCYRLDPEAFSHVLSELTIVVDPEFQGKGVGKMMFQALLEMVQAEMPDILRVELITRESNKNAIALYQKLGFKIEGRLENRIRSANGDLEADIPMAWMPTAPNAPAIR